MAEKIQARSVTAISRIAPRLFSNQTGGYADAL
jgi:hypothetical protein